ncbi:MRC [Mytilus coruscus]|uniref:MRC n=1 Tax=Mytilus coruscus TaxID=42192 RepID=A0A6J8CUA6_MYTCO|nr:MRC [Mytilus coruscus]
MTLFYVANLMIVLNVSVRSDTIKEEWQNINDFNDNDFTLYSLWTVSGKSASMCGNMCARDSRCLSFIWNKWEVRCKMFSKIFYTNALSTSIGNKYFTRKALADIFIDGNNTAVKNDWKYSDGSDITYLKWAPGEPNSIICSCDERCLTLQNKIPLNKLYFEGMNNMKCVDARPYICQLHIYA